MHYQAPLPDDVSPLDAHRDRQYWATLLSRSVIPGLRLAAYRIDHSERATKPLRLTTETLPQTQRLVDRTDRRVA
jgi:hypothetical protein